MEKWVSAGVRVLRAAILAIAALALLAVGPVAASARVKRAATAVTAFTVRGSVEQVDVTGARPGARLALLRHGHRVGSQRVDSLGGALFRNLTPGSGYRVAQPAPKATRSKAFTVLSLRSAPPRCRPADTDT